MNDKTITETVAQQIICVIVGDASRHGQCNRTGTAARALYDYSELAGVVELNWTAVHEITKGATPSAAAEDGDLEPSQKHGLCLFGRVCLTRAAGQ